MRRFPSTKFFIQLVRTLISLAIIAVGFTLMEIRQALATDFKVCNRTSYVLDIALAVESNQVTASNGWHRVFPGGCETVIQGTWSADRYFIHARTPEIYEEQPSFGATSGIFCVKRGQFLEQGAEKCSDNKGILVPFVEVWPEKLSDITTATLSDENNFTSDSARIAGLQRLLQLSGFNTGGIDGVTGDRTDRAIARFRQQTKLNNDTPDTLLFAELIDAAKKRENAHGLRVCNDTSSKIAVAVGLNNRKGLVTKGWYKLAPFNCENINSEANTKNEIFIFAEKIDNKNRPLSQGSGGKRWEGNIKLCTRNTRFEIYQHNNCKAVGLQETWFQSHRVSKDNQTTVRFGEG